MACAASFPTVHYPSCLCFHFLAIFDNHCHCLNCSFFQKHNVVITLGGKREPRSWRWEGLGGRSCAAADRRAGMVAKNHPRRIKQYIATSSDVKHTCRKILFRFSLLLYSLSYQLSLSPSYILPDKLDCTPPSSSVCCSCWRSTRISCVHWPTCCWLTSLFQRSRSARSCSQRTRRRSGVVQRGHNSILHIINWPIRWEEVMTTVEKQQESNCIGTKLKP